MKTIKPEEVPIWLLIGIIGIFGCMWQYGEAIEAGNQAAAALSLIGLIFGIPIVAILAFIAILPD